MPEKEIEKEIRTRLFELQDLKYKAFHSRLMPTIDPDTIIGVRTPALRNLVKEYKKRPEVSEFLKILPHRYYEENNFHGFLISEITDYDTCIKSLDAFLPYVDNWATCDLMSPKPFKKHPPHLIEQIKSWINTKQTYTVRFAVEMLMSFYLDENFDDIYPALVAQIRSEEYYVNMIIAWYFATALAKQYDSILPYITEQRLEKWTHNKTIQKAVESYRITDEQKAYLRTLKISK
ncbi:MAG TPA: DNA alkylation repair protein [Lachnospiraceae bacterium]|nr:DNA alkylation repair protein [Lachnospiraceae bacterium]